MTSKTPATLYHSDRYGSLTTINYSGTTWISVDDVIGLLEQADAHDISQWIAAEVAERPVFDKPDTDDCPFS